jgi:hypothetical protein
MRTTLNLDDKLVRDAMKVSPGMTKTAVIEEALRWYARRRSLAEFRKLRGKVKWEGNLDELRGRVPVGNTDDESSPRRR